MLHSLHVHSSRQAVTEISISHLVFSRLFLGPCTSESCGEFKILVKCDYFWSSGTAGAIFQALQNYFIKDISETYLSNLSHCYGGCFFHLLCNFFSVVALISGFPPLSLPHIFRKQPIHYGGDQITENQQQVNSA